MDQSTPRTCRICGRRITWRARRNAWTHDAKGIDHAPMPAPLESELELRAAWGDR